MPLKNARRTEKCGRLLLFCWCLSWPSLTSSAEYPRRYDGAIQAAVAKWWPDLPVWKLLKAQYWQESRLDTTARSPAGAEGIAQFMAPTWADAVRALGWPRMLSRRDATYAIEGGAWYMRKLRGSWKNRMVMDSHDLALASYNAGIGNILKAQGRCGKARFWAGIARCLVDVTGRTHARETTDYVDKIHRWHRAMELDQRH